MHHHKQLRASACGQVLGVGAHGTVKKISRCMLPRRFPIACHTNVWPGTRCFHLASSCMSLGNEVRISRLPTKYHVCFKSSACGKAVNCPSNKNIKASHCSAQRLRRGSQHECLCRNAMLQKNLALQARWEVTFCEAFRASGASQCLASHLAQLPLFHSPFATALCVSAFEDIQTRRN